MPRSLVWSALGYAGLALLLFHRLLLGEQLCAGSNIYETMPFATTAPDDFEIHGNAIQGDAWRQHGAWQRMQYEAAQRGEFRFWNPYPFLGMPFHGNGQTALFHPYSWPYYFCEPNFVRGPLAAVRLWLSAFACCMLLRRWGFGPEAAFVAGAAWMFAPFNIRWLHWPLSHSSLWLPILLLALDRFLVRPNGRSWCVAVLGALVLQLCGHPETQFQAGVAAGWTVLFRLRALGIPWTSAVWRTAGTVAAMIVGTIAAAPQLLPFLVQLPESADWVHHIHAAPQGLDPKAGVLFLAPDFWGRPRAGNMYEGPANYIEAGGGVGMLALALASVGFVGAVVGVKHLPRSARWMTLGAGLGAALFVALIFHAPFVGDSLMKLPLFDQANRMRWALAVQFWMCIAAAGGVDLVVRSSVWGRIPVFVLTTAFVVILAVLLNGRVPARFSKIKTAFEKPHWRTMVHHPAVRTTTGLAVAALGGLWLLQRLRRPGEVSALGLCGLVALEGFVAAWDFNATAPMPLADPPTNPSLQAALDIVGENRLIGTDEVLFPNLSVRYKFRDLSGYDWPLPLRMFDVLRQHRWRVVEGTSLPRKEIVPAPSPELAALLSRCSVRAVYTDLRTPKLTVKGNEWRQLAAGASADALYLNPTALPRARFAVKPTFGAAETAMAAISDPDLDSASIVESSANSPAELPAGTGSATIVVDEPERVEIDAATENGGVLILADRMAPGWSATVDGAPAEALTVDFLFRGVRVPPGKHRVVWRYEAPGFRLGLWLAAGCGALISVVCLFPPGRAKG